MADPRDPYGDDRSKRPPDQDTGSLLRDLRSLREAAAPRPGVARPQAAPPRPGGGPGRMIGGVLLFVLLVVGVAGYKAGVFEPGKIVTIGVSPTPGGSPPASGGPSVLTTGAPSPSATPVVTPPRVADKPPEATPGLVPAKVGLHFAVASFLLERFDTAVNPPDRFRLPPRTEQLAVTGGPAVWFARDASQFDDEIAVTSSAATAPCTSPNVERRAQVVSTLLRLTTMPGSAVERVLGQIATGESAAVVSPTPAGAPDTELSVALALAKALAGAPPAEVDRILADAPKQTGWSLALRAHVALMLNRRDDALQLLNQVNVATTGADELYLAAGLALRLGDHHLASGLLERIKIVSPADVYTLYWRGLIAEKVGRPDEALKRYADAISMCSDPRLQVAARVRRSLLHQKVGNHLVADPEWKSAEDFEPKSAGVWLAQAQSIHAMGELSKGSDRISRFQEALDRWQRLVVVLGPRDDHLGRMLTCYGELKDQATARDGIQFLSLLLEHGFLADSPLKGSVTQVIDTLKERLRPRSILEAAPR